MAPAIPRGGFSIHGELVSSSGERVDLFVLKSDSWCPVPAGQSSAGGTEGFVLPHAQRVVFLLRNSASALGSWA